MEILEIQAALRDAKVDGWLFYDHHYRDPIGYRILGLGDDLHVTRRWFYFVPAVGEPKKLVHRIESGRLDPLPGTKSEYSSWQELEAGLESLLAGQSKIAMQYSPRNAIMYVSMADAGTVELLRSFNKEIVSSADLVSQFEAVLTEAQIATHFEAGEKVDRVLAAGWQEIGHRIRHGHGTHEFAAVEFLQNAMRHEGLVWEHGTNVSVGPNSADSHYHPSPESSKPIQRGDFLLIDIWARLDRPHSCDAACVLVEAEFAAGNPIAGWQADEAARSVIRHAGFEKFFTHRTGHNIGNVLHGNGAHLDNLETHDERLLLPNTCFSVEPGLYFPGEFGVRSEVDMIARPGKAQVTGRIQSQLVRI
jgi:Xaa-Pro dipeptidase